MKRRNTPLLLNKRHTPFCRMVQSVKDNGCYTYFRPISRSFGTEVEVDGRRLIMIGSNDYLGLTAHPEVIEAAVKGIERFGSGPGGSRFLCGNLSLHEELEERLARFVGKKGAVVHTTGFLTNLGALSCLCATEDVILCDKRSHASVIEGCNASRARLHTFNHNDAEHAKTKIRRLRDKYPNSCIFLVTEGVFSMSGEVAPFDALSEIRQQTPEVYIYLDDAHGLGVLGPNGRGTAAAFGRTMDADFIMGTFSKSLASIGGFIACDDEVVLDYLKHQSRALMFSAALPAANSAVVLKCLDILERDDSLVKRLHQVGKLAKEGYASLGIHVHDHDTPILPIEIGDENKAYAFSRDLFEHNVFALPAVFPAVPKGKAIIRTAFMSTHTEEQVSKILEILEKLLKKHGITPSAA